MFAPHSSKNCIISSKLCVKRQHCWKNSRLQKQRISTKSIAFFLTLNSKNCPAVSSPLCSCLLRSPFSWLSHNNVGKLDELQCQSTNVLPPRSFRWLREAAMFVLWMRLSIYVLSGRKRSAPKPPGMKNQVMGGWMCPADLQS